MPIEVIDLATPPGHCVQRCANCEAQHTLRFDRGAIETRPGPFELTTPGPLSIRVDGGSPRVIPLTPGTLTAAALEAPLAAINGVNVTRNGDALVIESASTGPTSTIELAPSPGRRAILGIDDDWPALGTRPVLGVALGDFANEDAIVLRPCGCGAQETLLRTWDEAPTDLLGTRFDAHRRAVNALAQHFRDQGWVHPAIAATVRTAAPPDIMPLSPGSSISL